MQNNLTPKLEIPTVRGTRAVEFCDAPWEKIRDELLYPPPTSLTNPE